MYRNTRPDQNRGSRRAEQGEEPGAVVDHRVALACRQHAEREPPDHADDQGEQGELERRRQSVPQVAEHRAAVVNDVPKSPFSTFSCT